jgi:hypothetical protein
MPLSKGALNPFGTIHAGAMLWPAEVITNHVPAK